MKKLFFLLLLISSRAYGQSTTVSATITDTGGQAWIEGTYTLTFRVSPSNPTAQYMWNGSVLTLAQQTIAGHMDGSGHFSVSVPSNTSITPSQSTWDVQVCPIALGNSPCYTQKSLTITGTTQDISSSVIPPKVSIDLAHPAYPFVVAYTSAEITTAPLGGIFYWYNNTHYYICEGLSPTGQVQNYGVCTNWVEICQFGDSSCGGGIGGIAFEHNGVAVGTQSTVNVIDTGTVTATVVNDVADSRINISFTSTGGGTGCTLPGIDSVVLFEHPVGTCDGTLHWTWDDRTSKQNMLQGDGTNSVAGTPVLNFFIGSGNTATNSQTEAFLWGDSNVAGASGNVASYFMQGRSNTLTRGSDVYVTGESNTLNFTSGDFVNGLSNNLTTGTIQSIFNSFVTGRSNTLSAALSNSSNVIRDSYIFGFTNNITNNSTSTITPMQFLSVIGENNTITGSNSGGNSITTTHILGSCNAIADTLASVQETEVIGEQNSVDGASSTLEILGFLNTAHNVTPSTSTTSTATMVGLSNTITGSPTGSNSLAMTVGSHLTLTSCTDCFLYGRSGSTSTSNFLGMGMSNTPELTIIPGTTTLANSSAVRIGFSGTSMTQHETFTFCASGCDITGTPCSTTNSANATCTNVISWPTSFADANYAVNCTGVGFTGFPFVPYVTKSSGSVTVFTSNGQGSAATVSNFTEIDCTGTHR